MRTYVRPTRATRFQDPKRCERCSEVKAASEFPKVRGGGTTDVCTPCKARALSEAHAVRKEERASYAEHRASEELRTLQELERLRKLESVNKRRKFNFGVNTEEDVE